MTSYLRYIIKQLFCALTGKQLTSAIMKNKNTVLMIYVRDIFF